MKPRHVDLNCDMGEVRHLVFNGTQEAIMPWISSVNIACGGHAGDEEMMAKTIRASLAHGLIIGAHPGYPDTENFGRKSLAVSPAEISNFIFAQLKRFAKVAAAQSAPIVHVKAHGALYNDAANDEEIAVAFAAGVKRFSAEVVMVGLANSLMIDVFSAHGFKVLGEAFVDRVYEEDGTLRSRSFADALIADPAACAAQARELVTNGEVRAVTGKRIAIDAGTLCIHGDSANAVVVAQAVATELAQLDWARRSVKS